MNASTTLDISKKIETLEEELEFWKLKLFWVSRDTPKKERRNVVERTAGLLKKNFPGGIEFENEMRKSWRARHERLGL